MKNINSKLERAKELFHGAYQNLKLQLSSETPDNCLSAIKVLQNNLSILDRTIKLDIIEKEFKKIQEDSDRINEYVKLKRRLDLLVGSPEQPF